MLNLSFKVWYHGIEFTILFTQVPYELKSLVVYELDKWVALCYNPNIKVYKYVMVVFQKLSRLVILNEKCVLLVSEHFDLYEENYVQKYHEKDDACKVFLKMIFCVLELQCVLLCVRDYNSHCNGGCIEEICEDHLKYWLAKMTEASEIA